MMRKISEITTIILLILGVILFWFHISNEIKSYINNENNMIVEEKENTNNSIIIDTITKVIMLKDSNNNIYGITTQVLNRDNVNQISIGEYYGMYKDNMILIYDYYDKLVFTLYIKSQCEIHEFLSITSDDTIPIKVL